MKEMLRWKRRLSRKTNYEEYVQKAGTDLKSELAENSAKEKKELYTGSFRRWYYGLFRVNKFIQTCVQF